MEVTYQSGEAIEVEKGALGGLVARLGFATVYGLRLEEAPQLPSSPVALLNVSGCCQFADSSRAGLCVMLVGRDAAGGILWACCLMAQPKEQEPQQMLESLLIAPEVLGKTTRIALRLYGGRFLDSDGPGQGAPAERPAG